MGRTSAPWDEIKTLLTDSQQRKETIKRATELYLNQHCDMYLRWLFNIHRFEVLVGDTEDFVLKKGIKFFVLVENVCPEFVEAISELRKEEKLKINSNGYVLPGRKFKFSMWGKNGKEDPSLPSYFGKRRYSSLICIEEFSPPKSA